MLKVYFPFFSLSFFTQWDFFKNSCTALWDQDNFLTDKKQTENSLPRLFSPRFSFHYLKKQCLRFQFWLVHWIVCACYNWPGWPEQWFGWLDGTSLRVLSYAMYKLGTPLSPSKVNSNFFHFVWETRGKGHRYFFPLSPSADFRTFPAQKADRRLVMKPPWSSRCKYFIQRRGSQNKNSTPSLRSELAIQWNMSCHRVWILKYGEISEPPWERQKLQCSTCEGYPRYQRFSRAGEELRRPKKYRYKDLTETGNRA